MLNNKLEIKIYIRGFSQIQRIEKKLLHKKYMRGNIFMKNYNLITIILFYFIFSIGLKNFFIPAFPFHSTELERNFDISREKKNVGHSSQLRKSVKMLEFNSSWTTKKKLRNSISKRIINCAKKSPKIKNYWNIFKWVFQVENCCYEKVKRRCMHAIEFLETFFSQIFSSSLFFLSSLPLKTC